MTDLWDDATGPTAFIHGSEARAWNKCLEKFDLVDNYLCARIRKGPHYTRQAGSADRFDQSRLDRNYSSNRNNWCDYVRSVSHDGRQSLSDHIPVTTEFVLKEKLYSGPKRATYHKMDHKLLDEQQNISVVESLCHEHMIEHRDPRVNWDLAWVAIKKYLCNHEKEIRKQKERQLVGSRLEQHRIDVAENPSCSNIRHLEEERIRMKNQETEDAAKARTRSRVRWLKLGEAPSKYFFNQLKAKHGREQIKMLKCNDGEITEDESKILEQVFTFYEELYRNTERLSG